MGTPPDAELESLVRHFAKMVRSVAARVGGPDGREIAEDVEQAVFVGLWKQIQREQIIESPSSYIYRCAVRETIRLLKERRRHEDADALDPDALGRAGLADVAQSHERRQLLAGGLRSLAIDRRRAVQAHLAGFSVADTMKMYDWSYDRARNLIARGMADLRRELRKHGLES